MEFEVRPIQDSRQKWAEARPILRGMGFVLLAVGAFFVVNGLYLGAVKYRRIGQWVPVDAVVIECKMLDEHSARATNKYRAAFTFQYQVQGRTVFGSVLHDHTGSYASEVSDWKDYQRGVHQQVRYNPLNPREITIDDVNPRSFREPLKSFGWGLGLLLIGLAFKR
jgi:hypothetical protein